MSRVKVDMDEPVHLLLQSLRKRAVNLLGAPTVLPNLRRGEPNRCICVEAAEREKGGREEGGNGSWKDEEATPEINRGIRGEERVKKGLRVAEASAAESGRDIRGIDSPWSQNILLPVSFGSREANNFNFKMGFFWRCKTPDTYVLASGLSD